MESKGGGGGGGGCGRSRRRGLGRVPSADKKIVSEKTGPLGVGDCVVEDKGPAGLGLDAAAAGQQRGKSQPLDPTVPAFAPAASLSLLQRPQHQIRTYADVVGSSYNASSVTLEIGGIHVATPTTPPVPEIGNLPAPNPSSATTLPENNSQADSDSDQPTALKSYIQPVSDISNQLTAPPESDSQAISDIFDQTTAPPTSDSQTELDKIATPIVAEAAVAPTDEVAIQRNTAPPIESFYELTSQTREILQAHTHRAPNLCSIGTEFAPVLTRSSLDALQSWKRVRSSAFPGASQVITVSTNVTAATDTASAPSLSQTPVSHSHRDIQLSSATAANEAVSAPFQTPVSSSNEGIRHPAGRGITLPSGRRVFVTLPSLRGPFQLPSSNPPQGPRYRQEITAHQAAKHRLHKHKQAGSPAATNVIGGPRPLPRRMSFTPTKSSLIDSEARTPASPLDMPHDTPEQKEKIASLMSSFTEVGGSFDSIEWVQDDRRARRSESPETLVVPAQPVESYTTVGSLRPATNQQFTAPNRIQRDGTGRRAPQTNIPTRGHDSQLGGRSLNQQYNPGHGSSSHLQWGGTDYPQYGQSSQKQLGSMERSYGSMNQPASSMQNPHGPMLQPCSSMQSSYGSMIQPQHDSTSQPRFDHLAQPQYGAMSQPRYGAPSQSEYGYVPASQHGSTHQHQHLNRPLTQPRLENRNTHDSSGQTGFGSIPNRQTREIPASLDLNEAEKNILQANGLSQHFSDSSNPTMRSGNIQQQNYDMMPTYDPSLNPQAESFNIQGQIRGSGSRQVERIQHSMPTAQPSFERHLHVNTMQQLSRDTLSETSANGTHQVAMSSGTQFSQQSAMTGITSDFQGNNGDNNQSNPNHDSQDRGNLDHEFRFPPPGLAYPTQVNRPGTGYSQQNISGFGSNEQITLNQRHQVRPGLPPPITAGPPGHLQNIAYPFPGNPSAQGVRIGTTTLSSVQQPPTLPSNSPWLPHCRNNMFRSVHDAHSTITDTLPPSEVARYYPNGFPSDMTGNFTRRREAPDEDHPVMPEQEIRDARASDWFHSGIENLDMTANDHIAEMARRNHLLDNGPNSQPQETPDEYGNPPTLRGLVHAPEPLSVEEVNAMPITEVSARLLGPIFGNTLRIADQRPGPNNRALLSRYAPGAPWTIDDTPQGNQSFFGEDSGPTPRRVGRDPRYQPFE